MRFLLDTNLIIFALKNPEGIAASRIRSTFWDEILVCSIVEAELFHGATKYGAPERRRELLRAFLAPFQSVPFDSRCVPQYAEIRNYLEQRGTMIGANDLLIASIAVTYDFVLVTSNTSEFERVPDLAVVDWTK
ncbi:MAG: type II toxin-antitoxin system VapC family toxin [Verrucomicrobiales bacterium]